MTNEHDDLLDELMVADVHEGFPEKRAEMASALLKDGVTAADVRMLASHVLRTVGTGSPRRVLASLLNDRAKRDARVADLRAVAAKKAERALEANLPPGATAPFVPAPNEGEDRATWARDYNAVVAYTLIHREGKVPTLVAADMGIDLATLEELVARGAELRPRPPKPVKPAPDTRDEDAKERIKTFREQMRKVK